MKVSDSVGLSAKMKGLTGTIFCILLLPCWCQDGQAPFDTDLRSASSRPAHGSPDCSTTVNRHAQPTQRMAQKRLRLVARGDCFSMPHESEIIREAFLGKLPVPGNCTNRGLK